MEADAPTQAFAALTDCSDFALAAAGTLGTNALSGACWRGDRHGREARLLLPSTAGFPPRRFSKMSGLYHKEPNRTWVERECLT
jgi:hypothetical protein